MPGKILIVLPAFNEETAIGGLIRSIDDVCSEIGLEYLIVVIDDGSSDRTREIVTGLMDKAPIRLEYHDVNMNLGAAIRDGLKEAAELAADDDIIITMDADGTHPPALIPQLIGEIGNGKDVVIASRYRAGSKTTGVPFHRKLLSLGAAIIFKATHPLKGVRDYTCGYRAYRASVIKRAFSVRGEKFIERSGFQCMAEILLKLRGMNISFGEVPLVLRYDLKGGESKMRVMETVISSLALIAAGSKDRGGGC